MGACNRGCWAGGNFYVKLLAGAYYDLVSCEISLGMDRLTLSSSPVLRSMWI